MRSVHGKPQVPDQPSPMETLVAIREELLGLIGSRGVGEEDGRLHPVEKTLRDIVQKLTDSEMV